MAGKALKRYRLKKPNLTAKTAKKSVFSRLKPQNGANAAPAVMRLTQHLWAERRY
jgi:hypothetical protein